MVAFALYNTKPLFTNSGSWTNYKKNASEVRKINYNPSILYRDFKLEYLKFNNLTPYFFLMFQLKHGLRESNLQLIPSELRPTIKLLLNATAELRPTAAQLSQIPYFEVI